MSYQLPTFNFLTTPGSRTLTVKKKLQPSIWKSAIIIGLLGLALITYSLSVGIAQFELYKFQTNNETVKTCKDSLQIFLMLFSWSIIFISIGYFINVQMEWKKTGYATVFIGLALFICASLGLTVISIKYYSSSELNDDQKSLLLLIGSMMIIFYLSIGLASLGYYLAFVQIN